MGLRDVCKGIGESVLAVAPDLKGKIYFGRKYIQKNMSAPSLIFTPGGMPDRLSGAQNAGRVPRSLRTRGAACVANVFGKSLSTRAGMTESQSGDDYTDTEWLMHQVIAAIYLNKYGACEIGPPIFVDEGDLAQYGEHYRIPFWVAMQVHELIPYTEATVREVQVLRGQVNWDDIL